MAITAVAPSPMVCPVVCTAQALQVEGEMTGTLVPRRAAACIQRKVRSTEQHCGAKTETKLSDHLAAADDG